MRCQSARHFDDIDGTALFTFERTAKLTICSVSVKPESCSSLEFPMFHVGRGFAQPPNPGIAPAGDGTYACRSTMMLRFHIRQNLRSAFFLVVLLAAVAAPIALWQVNRTGLPDSWRALVERELSNQGIYLQIGALQYLPLQGIAARDVRIFAEPELETELSRIGRILLDFDKTKLARGDLRLNKMQLANADVTIPADTGDPDSETLKLTSVNGQLLMPGGRVLEIRNARGRVGTIDVTVNARLLGYRSSGTGGLPREDTEQRGKRREFIAVISREIERWSHPADQRPKVEIRIHGDLSDMGALSSSFTFQAPVMALNNHEVEDISISGELLGSLLVLNDIRLRDTRGTLRAHADYDLKNRAGRFDGECTLDLTTLARSWFGFQTPDALLVGGGQTIKAAGKFQMPADGSIPKIQATGNFTFESIMLRGVVFDRVQSAFSMRGNEFFFRDTRVERPDGAAWGKAFIQWPLVRIAMETTLPAPVYKPFFMGQPLEQVIDSFTVGGQSKFHIALEGGFDARDRYSWAYHGHGKVERIAYNGVPVASARSSFSLSHHELDFHDGDLILDTSNYRQRLAHDGPAETRASVGAIRYIHKDRMLEISDVRGEFWVPPVLALFNNDLAKTMEAYQFHRPPRIQSSGVVDITPAGRTRLDIRFETSSPAATEVLGRSLTFSRAQGNVLLRGERVEVNGLDLMAFNGPVSASFAHTGKRLSAEIAWTRLDLHSLAGAYGVTMQGGGTTTGRIEFSQSGGSTATLKGNGHVGFENAHLFAVPMLGPLSPMIAAVVNDRRTGYERAKDAFLTFEIQDGVIRSNDFRTTTTSLTITGDGAIDLNDETVDMTMRVNARGLLGLITLPLRPFYGLFQFRGTGPMREPEWENVIFTNPPPSQRDSLLNPPKANVVPEPGSSS
jgi:hypothetical protein